MQIGIWKVYSDLVIMPIYNIKSAFSYYLTLGHCQPNFRTQCVTFILYFFQDEAKGSGNLLAPMKADKGKYSNFVSSNSKRKLIQYDDALDIQ